MINKFQNLLRFVDIDDSQENPKSFHAPKGKLSPLPVQHGDALRVLVPKSDLKGLDQHQVRVALLSKNTEGAFVIANNQIGSVRVQDCENYTQIKVVVKKAPSAGDYRQLALVRPNGVVVLGSFTSQQSNLDEYCRELKEFWESYPHANVFVSRNGNLLTLKIYHSPFFRLENETLSIGVGQVIDYNTNTPSIVAKKINTVTKPAQDCYPIIVGDDVQEGNIFSVQEVSYQAQASDTAAKVLEKLLGASDCVIVADGDPVEVRTQPGTRIVKNTEKPIVGKSALNSDATYTYWRISVQGKITPGNYIEVSAPGSTSVRVTVDEDDTIASIEAILNPNAGSGGSFRANNGAQVSISVLAGQQEIVNTNNPSISLGTKEDIASQTVDRYQITIGASVVEGNIFHLKDSVYTAKLSDTAQQVALALGGSQSSFIIEVEEDAEFDCYAVPGKKYNDRHAAEAVVLEQPAIRKSQQMICEMLFSSNLAPGHYHVGIVNQDTGTIELVSNPIHLSALQKQSALIEVGGRMEFGYEYLEDMLTQRLRVPVYLMRPKNTIDGSFGSQLGGSAIKMNTRIIANREFVTTALTEESADALTVWMQHRNLKINSENYLQTGSYEEEVISQGSGLKQLSGSLQSLDEKNNFPELLQGFYTDVYGSAIISGTGLQIYLQSGSFVRRLSTETQLLNVAEYEVFLQTGPDNVLLSIYRNGTFERRALVKKNSRSKLSSFLRLGAQDQLMFSINQSNELIGADYVQGSTKIPAEDVSYIAEASEKYLYNQFSDDFNEDYKI